MAPDPAEKKPEKSYLSSVSSAVDSINPWANSRTTTPTPGNKSDEPAPETASPIISTPADHVITPLYGQSSRTYPADCPPLNVQWFHAVDVPKRKPQISRGRQVTQKDTKPPAQPKKFSAFSPSDSRRIETRYQKLLEAAERRRGAGAGKDTSPPPKTGPAGSSSSEPAATESSASAKGGARVPVNEDFLFDVDIEQRELAPAYWRGLVYEVRRGIWFFQEGSTVRPCEENLAAQLEEGYLKTKPWLNPIKLRSRAGSNDGKPEPPEETVQNAAAPSAASTLKPPPKLIVGAAPPQAPSQPPSYRLFESYMNSMVTYQDSNTAWLSSGSMLSWVTTSVYERFAGGGYLSGVKLIRGYTEPSKIKEKERAKVEEGAASPLDSKPGLDERQQKILKRRSAPADSRPSVDPHGHASSEQSGSTGPESQERRLRREISSLIENDGKSSVETEEYLRKRDEEEIQDDYNARDGEAQGREIEHLVLVTHGIGQLLGLRMESINFIHDVNTMRKTIKSVYANSADLKALNSELGGGPGNCRVQLMPVCWRHLLEFPRKRKRGEHDLGDTAEEEDDYPSLEDITVEGAAFARSLMSDLALDVLLYQSSYREEISRIVLGEANRIFKLFKERNPNFKGTVHVMGHSLGSAILFDILCRQREQRQTEEPQNPLRFWPSPSRQAPRRKEKDDELAFDFDVQDLYCLGSPIGLFQMLKGRTIAARQSPNSFPSESPFNPDEVDDPFFVASPGSKAEQISSLSGLPISVSSPKVGQIFNIFHPSDPISYRMEPLISPAMSSLKPQALPYTKRGIFGNVATQGLGGISAKVGQSVSGLWSSLSAGVANNILKSGLGLTSEQMAQMATESTHTSVHGPVTGTGATAGSMVDTAKLGEQAGERMRQLADSTQDDSGNNPTLIDDDLETLYSRFQSKHAGESEETQVQNVDVKARKLRVEEAKVRALNRNGRVDYSIQEGALDFNPMNTIASHISYWGDVDVNHFILSQLLSNQASKSKK